MNSLSLRRWAALIFLTTLPGWLVAEQGPPQQDDNLATATAELKELPREIVLDGVVEAIQQSTVSAQTGGQVVEILFDVDDFVQKGDLIVRLKSTEQKAGLTQAEAELKSAQAKMREAQNEYTRIKDIFAKKLVSQSDMDKANAALKTAKAAAEAAAATINQAREQLSYTEVRAPYSGIVTSRQVEIGEIAQPGQPLMTGISLDKLRVIVDVPQRLIPGIRKHMQASIILPDGETVEARKITIFPFADQATNTFKVRLELPENLAGMFPGMFIKAAFQTGAKKELLIPAQAVVYRSEVTGVYVLDESNKIHLRHVRLGHPVEDGMISVLSGINPGDKVALDPIAAGVTLKKAAKAEADNG